MIFALYLHFLTNSGSLRILRFFLFLSVSRACSSYSGATMHSKKCLLISSAVSSSTFLFSATIPPNADNGSLASAASYASINFLPTAIPHGELCLTITHAGSLKSKTAINAESRSTKLLKESGLPHNTSAFGMPSAGGVM